MIMAKTVNGELNKQEVHEDFVEGFKKRGWVVIEQSKTTKVSEEPLKPTKETKTKDTNGKKTNRPETGGEG